MITIIRITDSQKNVLSFDLIDILSVIKPFASNLIWSVIALDAIDKDGNELSDPLGSTKNSSEGHVLDWNDLFLLSQKFLQIMDGVFIACQERRVIPIKGSGDIDFSSCDIVIHANDSTCWDVITNDKRIIDALKNNFKRVEIITRSDDDWSNLILF